MKSVTSFFLLLFVFAKSYSQNCKFKKNEIDKFTGQYVKITSPFRVIGTFYTAGDFSIRKEDSTYSFIFDYAISAYSEFPPYSINRGQQLLFLLESGEKIILESADNIVGVNTVFKGTMPVYTCNLSNVTYHLSKAQLVQFMNSKVKTIRFYRVEPNGKADFLDNEIKQKNQNDISKLVKCIL